MAICVLEQTLCYGITNSRRGTSHRLSTKDNRSTGCLNASTVKWKVPVQSPVDCDADQRSSGKEEDTYLYALVRTRYTQTRCAMVCAGGEACLWCCGVEERRESAEEVLWLAHRASVDFTSLYLSWLGVTIHFLACESSPEWRNVAKVDTGMGST